MQNPYQKAEAILNDLYAIENGVPYEKGKTSTLGANFLNSHPEQNGPTNAEYLSKH